VLAFIIGFTVITAFHITIGEQYPKTYAIRQSEQVTLWSAMPMVLFYKVMYPFIWALNGVSNWMLRKSGIEPDGGHEKKGTGYFCPARPPAGLPALRAGRFGAGAPSRSTSRRSRITSSMRSGPYTRRSM
jgi:hypothetical protein